jgi:hypothetical protein
MSIISLSLALSTLLVSADPGCVIGGWNNPEKNCMSVEMSSAMAQNCTQVRCTDLPTPKINNICYYEMGICRRTDLGCQWEMTQPLSECLKKAEKFEEQCSYAACTINGCSYGAPYWQCYQNAQVNLLRK